MIPRRSLLILSFSNIRSDPRVLKQVELFRDEYEVTTCGFGETPEGVSRHIRLPDAARSWVDDRISLVTRCYRLAYENIQAVRAARRLLPVGEFEVVLANDLNTLPLAISLVPAKGVHADLHEFAPREKEDDLKWRLFVAPFMRWLCRTYLPKVASATTVAGGIAREYERDYGVPFGVVTNAAPFVDRQPQPVGETIRLVHSAAGQRYRRLEQFVQLMKDAPSGVSLDLIIMPNEPEYVAELKALGAGLESLRFRDPVPYNRLVGTIAEYDVALTFLPPSNFNLAHALPNKFFEAVQARVGLVIGPSPEMKAILTAHKFGVVTDDFEVESLRAVLTDLDRNTVMGWKQAAHRAAHELSSEQQVRGWQVAIADLMIQ